MASTKVTSPHCLRVWDYHRITLVLLPKINIISTSERKRIWTTALKTISCKAITSKTEKELGGYY
jgi:hypothetical protein